jgi:hypothetical protein
MDSLVHEVPDRQLLVAIFNAITGLPERLTGEKIVVFVPSAEGDLPYHGVPAAWLPIRHREAVATHDVHSQSAHSSTQPVVPQERHDIQQEHC